MNTNTPRIRKTTRWLPLALRAPLNGCVGQMGTGRPWRPNNPCRTCARLLHRIRSGNVHRRAGSIIRSYSDEDNGWFWTVEQGMRRGSRSSDVDST